MAVFVRRYGTLLGIVLVIGYFWLELPNTFLTERNLLNISQQMSMLAVVAGTMTVVMAMGDFDLSVGSMASLSGIVAALVFISGGSTLTAVAAALLCGLVGGLINGFLVSYVGILPFIATLGAMTVYGGLAFKLSGARPYSAPRSRAAVRNSPVAGCRYLRPAWSCPTSRSLRRRRSCPFGACLSKPSSGAGFMQLATMRKPLGSPACACVHCDSRHSALRGSAPPALA